MGAATTRACTNQAFNGTFLQGVSVTLAQSGSSFQMATADVDSSRRCNWTGTYPQDGQVGRVGGNYSCSTGETGTFRFFEIQSSMSGIMGRLSTVVTLTTCKRPAGAGKESALALASNVVGRRSISVSSSAFAPPPAFSDAAI